MTITLNEEQIKQLEVFFQEMPTKYGLPLLKYFNDAVAAQNPAAEDVKTEEVEG